MTDQRTSDVSTATAPTIIESFTETGLPAPGSAGRLARVTDRPARLWLDDGTGWSPLVGNVVNVLSYGSFGSPDTTTAAINAATYAASQSGASVYLPAATYTINGPLLFYAGQTIFGDGKSATVITTPAKTPITMFRFAGYPAAARDVMIRDLSIVNRTPWQHGSIGIDFTGIGFSRIERVSLNSHGTAIIGRDSALRTYVIGSTDKLLHVTATDTLYFGTAPIAIAIEGYQAPGGQAVLLYGNVTRVADPHDPDYPGYPALYVTLTGSNPTVPLPPLTDIPAGAKVFHNNRVDYGYYNSVADCDIANCIRGLSLTNDGDEWTVLDGQFRSNICGIYVEASDGNRFRTTFSSNGVGIEFGSRGVSNTVLAGSYFEGNGDLSRWTDPTLQPAVLGAVRCHVDPAGNPADNPVGNTVETSALSNYFDNVADETDGDNVCTSPHLRSFPAMPSGTASGRNILFNGDFAVDSDNDNIADGWTPSTSVPPGTLAIVSDPVPAGTRTAQQWTMKPGRNPLFRLYRQLEVIPGQWYTFTARTMADTDDPDPANKDVGLYTLLITTAQGQTLYNQHLPKHDFNTGFHRRSFQIPPGVTSIYVILHNNDNTPADLPQGCYVPDGNPPANAWFGKFQLEPGRGISTESRDSGLMGHVETSGGPLTIGAKTASSISVTHPYHTVAPGAGAVLKQIVPPAGFSGMIVLTATGSWTATTDGSGPGKIGTPLTMTAGKTVFGWYDTSSGTWWFTPA
ncbi:MAG TPA: glycosyl hydrolase family 28-related protein [Streptosporangiaceae bacterium]